MVVEEFRHDEMKQCPQLLHRVLNWCSCQEKAISSVELEEYFPSSTVVVLDRLSFIKDHIVPFDLE